VIGALGPPVQAYLLAFGVGGAWCLAAQLVFDLTSYRVTPAHVLVGFVSVGCILSGLGLYQPLVELAGAGATVPLPSFGHALMQGVIKAIERDGLLGALFGGLEATAFGVTVAVIFSYLMAVLFRPRG